ncbi:adenosylmethionine decarboxylase [Synechococcus sp. RSCCF101]|uniref:adenosylmethionine decarboxylase n=1 Tax=Synechococcus sp. RSCCF101 TaxID=2511069 RepID=UPI0012450D48|nr:adenosylmethionine decarboxylase [Synechococcus sp. RSCCF101]QEY32156.1 adenosylmethionine decarboxylase [Synechococcus sp. RSCCF101]
MKQTLSCLHPHPGWSVDDPSPESGPPLSSPTGALVGKHCILELYDCSSVRLNDESFIAGSLTRAASEAGATLLRLVTHRFEPQGVTGLALLAESHVSIHTWPESGYAAVDVFTCGDHTMPELACAHLREALLAGRYSLRSFLREAPAAVAGSERAPLAPQLQAA